MAATLATTTRQHRRIPTSTSPATARHIRDMNSAIEIRSALASVVKTYEPSRRVRFKTLAPFRDEIRELRSKGAAFGTIAQILKKHSVNASHETVRRFYREEIEQKPRRRKRTRNRSGTRQEPRQQRRNENNNGHAPRPVPTKAERGPRIARVEDL